MQEQIQKAIEAKAKSLLKKEEKRRYIKKKYRTKFTLRTGIPATVTPFRFPRIWDTELHFDPRYCLKHSKFLAKIIWQKIQTGDYDPLPAMRISIPKPTGGERTIMVFSIPDAAVANLFYRRLRDKNSSQFSPFTYAYLRDRGLFDAVIQLKSYIDAGQGYLVEMDFSKYFDTIEHRYIEYLMKTQPFNFSNAERNVIGAFLNHRIADSKSYSIESTERRTVGVPQGSSISLFLANLAGHELDRKLEEINGRFVRFADDVVVVTKSHKDAVNVVNAFEDHCRYSGISINYEKSNGISLLQPSSKTNVRSFFLDEDDGHDLTVRADFDYLGHKFQRDAVLLSSRSVTRAKNRVAKIMHLNLLYSLDKGGFDARRITGTGFDWDLLNCINELRRFIYGNIRQDELQNFVSSGTKIKKFRGFIGFCPLVDKVDQFSSLDGWVIDVLRRTLKERYSRIAPGKIVPSKADLISGAWFKNEEIPHLEASLPSFALAWRAARKRYKLQGLKDFDSPSYYSGIAGGLAGFHYG